MSSSATKPTTIATHSGTFHADEALAVYMLQQLYSNSTIVRTRDSEKIEKADIVVDVGAKYDPATHRYDHHQREFTTTFDSSHSVTKLSSAGLIYKHFGKDVLRVMLGPDVDTSDESFMELVYQKAYTDFVEGMDAIDNGVSQYPSDLTPKYKESTNLSRRVGRLNPAWNDPVQDNLDERFMKAVKMCGDEFADVIKSIALSWIPARDIVKKCIESRLEVHPSGKIVVLDQFCPWKEHLYNLENEMEIPGTVLYVLYSDQSGAWRIQAVAVHQDSFESRKALPESWRGLRDEDLSKAISIPDCVFVHASGFIGGNKTKEGALEMAIKAIA